jgi:tetratricopeptide (TPR) repeat protein
LSSVFFFTLFLTTLSPAQSGIDFIFNDAVDKYFEPLITSEIVDVSITRKILKNYRNKQYHSAIVDLKKLVHMRLPDGRLEAYTFMLAECYHQLDLSRQAIHHYSQILRDFPNSMYRAESMFRMIQNYHTLDSIAPIIRIWKNCIEQFPGHPMTSASAYVYAKFLIEKEEYQKAFKILDQVKSDSPISHSAKFLSALCLIWQNEFDKGQESLLLLDSVSQNPLFKSECMLTIGLLNHQQGKHELALTFYNKIPESSPRFPLANLKKAMVHLSQENFQKAIDHAKPIMENKELFFEASLVLLDAYWGLQDSSNALIVRNRLVLHAKLTRLIMMTEEEKFLISNMQRQWSAYSGLMLEKKLNINELDREVQKKSEDMLDRLEKIKASLKPYSTFEGPIQMTGVLEKRLLELTEI